MAHLAKKAFYPARIPFPLVHIDTGHNFQETLDFRDDLAAKLNAKTFVGSVQKMIDKGLANDEKGYSASRNVAQIPALLHTIEAHKFDALCGGARRDEEKARAKERLLLHRDEFGQWDPKNQRPELWNIFNGRKHMGKHFRVFPISQLDRIRCMAIYRQREHRIAFASYAHQRDCFVQDGVIYAASEHIKMKPNEKIENMTVRFRTMGDITITGAYLSTASTIDEIIQEIAASRHTEQGTRADDKRSETAMEDKKKEGYF